MYSTRLPGGARQKLGISTVSIARSWGILPEDGSPPKVVPFTCTQVSFKTLEKRSDDTEQEPPMLEASQELAAKSSWVAGLDSQAEIPSVCPVLVLRLLLCV